MTLAASGDGPLQRLASLKFTLGLFALFLLCIGLYLVGGRRHDVLIALPLLLFTLNLAAAVLVQPGFRAQAGLLAFHLALMVLVLLVAIGRLSYLTGELELTRGQTFAGELTRHQAGVFHPWRLDMVKFRLEGFTIDYGPGMVRDVTRCTLSWRDGRGEWRQGVVGDHRPFVQAGYRFYTTHNKGFAALFDWQLADGPRGMTGSVHFPPYPAREFSQAQQWSPTGSDRALWMQLQFDETILDPAGHSQFHLPAEHLLVVRDGERRYELRPGETLELPEGRLHYRGLSSWMGFHVTSDWTRPWLLAAGLLAVLSLGWHYWLKFSARPWLAAQGVGE